MTSPLRVFTARIGFRDPDVLDVTRKSAGHLGLAFAPSWQLLGPFLDDRKAGRPMDWDAYVLGFNAEMEASYLTRPKAWKGLLSAPRAVLVCYCANHLQCHRTLLARDILPRLGAVYGGEFVTEPAQKGMFNGR